MRQVNKILALIVAIIGATAWPTTAKAQDYGRDRYGDLQVRNPVRDAYQEGMRDGQFDARHDRRPIPHQQNFGEDRTSRAYQIGYDRGFDQAMSERGGWTNRDAYTQGQRAGDADARRNRSFNPRPDQFARDEQSRRAFMAGYNQGYHNVQAINVGGLEIFLGGGSGRREQDDRRSEGLYNPQYGNQGGNPQYGNQGGNPQRGYNQPGGGSVTIQGTNVSGSLSRRMLVCSSWKIISRSASSHREPRERRPHRG